MFDGQSINHWTKPLIPSLHFSLSYRLFGSNNDKRDVRDVHQICKVDIVIGGDHGQKKFRMVAKIICRNGNDDVIDSWVIKIGHIDHNNETYDILRRTITPQLNNDINKLLEGNKVLNLYKKDESYTVQIQEGNVNGAFICPITNNTDNTFTLVRSCTIRILMTGDLAYYASCLGKVHMASNWCTWCKLGPHEWGAVDHNKGDEWTLEGMDELRESITNGDQSDTARNRKGCVHIPLFNKLPIDHYVYPILHAEIGLGNYLLNSFF
jgi:hypothetical protein